ncbi:fasciclin-like arabinogalactan protein 2 [Salvia divinorum]|uniref:Fasciclin-like arabinogalactan protein 2 n=1 Tax=Salvia divinorum TaxID=28513 RepID=A0ABD1IPG9_SALDI
MDPTKLHDTFNHSCHYFVFHLILFPFSNSVQGGLLTVFFPSDEALAVFRPRYKNPSADRKASLLLYHDVPVYNSLGVLRSSSGLVNKLATERDMKFDFTIYEVLPPKKLFKAAPLAPATKSKGKRNIL